MCVNAYIRKHTLLLRLLRGLYNTAAFLNLIGTLSLSLSLARALSVSSCTRGSSRTFIHSSFLCTLSTHIHTQDAGGDAHNGLQVRKISGNDIQLVQNLIERCLQLYMDMGEVVKTLQTQAGIEPGFTSLGTLWRCVCTLYATSPFSPSPCEMRRRPMR